MAEEISSIQRTFPKKTVCNNLNSKKRIRKKGYQKYVQSVFDESNDDCDDDEIEVNLKQQFNNKKAKKTKKQKVFIEKNAANQSKESLLSKECNSHTSFSAENDGFVSWNSKDDQSSSKKPVFNFNKNRSNGRKEQLSSISNERKNNIDFNNLQKSETEMKDDKLSSTNNIKQDEFDGYSSDEKQAEFTKKSIQNTISPVKKQEESNFDNEEFREKIAKIPLGKTKQLKERLGTKLFDKAFFVHDPSSIPDKKPTQKVFVRENPKRPREVSSKMPVSKFRNIFANEKLERPILDPRFDNRCGEFNDYIYHNNYSFLDEIRQREKKILVKELKNMTEGGNIDKNRLKEALRKIKNQEKTRADVNRRKEIIREIRHENNERMRQGLPPVFKTRAQIRELLWRKKYDELKGGKKLEKYLRRKTKKQDRRHDINKSVSHKDGIVPSASD